MEEMEKAQLMQMIIGIVQRHDCRILELDLDNQTINIEGSEDAKMKCATELEFALGNMDEDLPQ